MSAAEMEALSFALLETLCYSNTNTYFKANYGGVVALATLEKAEFPLELAARTR